MRQTANNNGVSVKAYAGTTDVMLAMNIAPARLVGYSGLLVQRFKIALFLTLPTTQRRLWVDRPGDFGGARHHWPTIHISGLSARWESATRQIKDPLWVKHVRRVVYYLSEGGTSSWIHRTL